MNPIASKDAEDTQAPEGQQEESYEARFKGMQREYNKLQPQLKAAQEALDAANAKLKNIGSTHSDALAAAQNDASEARLKLTASEASLKDWESKYGQVDQELSKYRSKESIRRKIIAQQAQDVLPAFETDLLNIQSDDDTEVQSKINAFRQLVSGMTQAKNQQKFSGSSLPNVTPANSGGGQSVETLQQWLIDHVRQSNTPEYAQNQELLDQLIANSQ